MSRLSGTRREIIAENKERIRINLSVTLVLVLFLAGILAVVLIGATYYSLTKVGAVKATSTSLPTTTTTTSTTTTTTTTTVSTTTTSTSTSTTSSSETTVQETTTTTLSRERIALCMQGRISGIYLKKGVTIPSMLIETYLGPYASMLPITDCGTLENRQTCDGELRDYAENERLVFDGKKTKSIGYPVVVLSKDRTAYIVRSSAEFERIVGCGSLKDA